MKKLLSVLFITVAIIACKDDANDVIPSYVGKYYLIKNYAIINGVKGEETIHQGNCSGNTFYDIREDDNVKQEVWASQSLQCKRVGLFNYIYDKNKSEIEGQKVEFDGNTMKLKNVSSTILNIYIYKK